jgi:hypothetical protein
MTLQNDTHIFIKNRATNALSGVSIIVAIASHKIVPPTPNNYK